MTNEPLQKFHKFLNEVDEVYEKNINNFIINQFCYVQIYSIQINKKDDKSFLKTAYFKKFSKIVHYLIKLINFNYLNRKKF